MLHLVLASFLWALSFALIGKNDIDPDLLAASRLGLAFLLFAPLLLLRRVDASIAIYEAQFALSRDDWHSAGLWRRGQGDSIAALHVL